MTKIASALPKGDANGLNSIAPALVDYPETVRLAVVAYDTKKIETDTDSGDVEPTVRIRHIEPLTGDDATAAAGMLRTASQRRTGKSELPFDEDVDWNVVDTETGEILDGDE